VGWSILIVDDSAMSRSKMRTVFEAKGARVVEAENGSEGLWRARAEQFDLITTDVHMPIMTGLQMIAELRKMPAYAATPIFVLTSDAAPARAADGRKAGADAWVLKPIDSELVWKTIEKALFGKSRTGK